MSETSRQLNELTREMNELEENDSGGAKGLVLKARLAKDNKGSKKKEKKENSKANEKLKKPLGSAPEIKIAKKDNKNKEPTKKNTASNNFGHSNSNDAKPVHENKKRRKDASDFENENLLVNEMTKANNNNHNNDSSNSRRAKQQTTKMFDSDARDNSDDDANECQDGYEGETEAEGLESHSDDSQQEAEEENECSSSEEEEGVFGGVDGSEGLMETEDTATSADLLAKGVCDFFFFFFLFFFIFF
jgi:hypothetical protein